MNTISRHITTAFPPSVQRGAAVACAALSLKLVMYIGGDSFKFIPLLALKYLKATRVTITNHPMKFTFMLTCMVAYRILIAPRMAFSKIFEASVDLNNACKNTKASLETLILSDTNHLPPIMVTKQAMLVIENADRATSYAKNVLKKVISSLKEEEDKEKTLVKSVKI
jgi:hypothetical protein